MGPWGSNSTPLAIPERKGNLCELLGDDGVVASVAADLEQNSRDEPY